MFIIFILRFIKVGKHKRRILVITLMIDIDVVHVCTIYYTYKIINNLPIRMEFYLIGLWWNACYYNIKLYENKSKFPMWIIWYFDQFFDYLKENKLVPPIIHIYTYSPYTSYIIYYSNFIDKNQQ